MTPSRALVLDFTGGAPQSDDITLVVLEFPRLNRPRAIAFSN
jgi:hypothetical protein